MPKTLLTVATRKGTFLLESDDRRDWTMRGPYCEGWPIYHAIYDATTGVDLRRRRERVARLRRSGAAATSARRGSMSSEGLTYGDDDGRKISKVSTLARAGDRLLVGVEAPGIFESRDNGETWSLLSTLSGQHGSEEWDDPGEPAARAPRHLGLRHRPRRLRQLLRDRAGRRRLRDRGRRRVVDAAQQGPARATGRAELRGRRLLRAQARPLVRPAAHVPAEPRRHAPLRRRRQVVDRDHRGPAGRLRLRRGRAPARHATRSTSSRSTAATVGRCTRARRRSGARATPARAGSRCAAACRRRTRTSACCARAMTIDTHDKPGLYFGTSTGQVFASADEGETWSEIASYLPSISSVDVAVLD